ncbi:MAG TPA: hypothetical protein VGE35_01725 [Candidatus Paceibacterota bacterium]
MKSIFILFGATGDLAQKKIFPALDVLFSGGTISSDSKVIGVSRRDWDDEAFLDHVAKTSKKAPSAKFSAALRYSKIDIGAGTGYEELASKIFQYKKEIPDAQIAVYLSLAPQFHAVVAKALFKAGIAVRGQVKLLVEKPFGTNGATARELNDVLTTGLDEADIYRIDHYLSKEAAQCLMDATDKHSDIKSIRARIFEEKGIDGRGESYDGVGAFRDVGQNHMLEMVALALVSASGGARDGNWQSVRASVLSRLIPPENTCADFRRGQYDGYLAEKGVSAGSVTETAFRVVTMLDRILIILESGKKMPSSEASILVSYGDGSQESYDFKKGKEAYETMIAAALRGSHREFVGLEEVLALWSYSDRAHACWDRVPLEIYSGQKPFLVE